jgi:tetratricopeptide (TPR) repeat protein
MKLPHQLALAALLLLPASALYGQATSRTRVGLNNPQHAADIASTLASSRSPASLSSPPAGIVDKRDLLVSPKAVKEFRRSMKAIHSGDDRLAAVHLEKAVEIAPSFVEAHNNLGAVYLSLKEYDKAALETQRAIALNPSVVSYHNLALTLAFLQRFPEAEGAVRQALAITPGDPAVRLTLGRILAMEGRNTPEAMELLTEASHSNPEAHLFLAQVLGNGGHTGAAITELQTYLRNPSPRQRQIAESWLLQLMQSAKTAARAGSTTSPDPE